MSGNGVSLLGQRAKVVDATVLSRQRDQFTGGDSAVDVDQRPQLCERGVLHQKL
ncbi:hypothetical protein [Streptosporangium sp. G12]